jgi:hypothetical protein
MRLEPNSKRLGRFSVKRVNLRVGLQTDFCFRCRKTRKEIEDERKPKTTLA